jgi:hydroxymethylbilane synthase
MRLTFATRPSALALWQTRWVMQALQSAWPGLICFEKIITTHGDRVVDKPLPEIGGKGVFTQELEVELLSGRVQVAVHSLKDLPVEDPPGLAIGAIPERGEARDALISAMDYTLETLPQGARVGTSSLRRSAQLLNLRPDLQIEPLRGNVDTRLRKALEGQYEAVILAGAGLIRLGQSAYITQWLPLDVMLPAPGQGALAVQCRSDDLEITRLLAALECPSTRAAITAERSFLSGLGGGCAVPVAAYARIHDQDGRQVVGLQGMVASTNGQRAIRVQGMGEDPFQLGMALAKTALSEGANEILV